MPDRDQPRWVRLGVRAALTGFYTLVGWEAWAAAVLVRPPAVQALAGDTIALVIGVVVAVATSLCAAGQATHQWLLERAMLPWAVTGALIYAIALEHRMVGAAVAVMVVRIIQLEAFARQQPRPLRPPWRHGRHPGGA